MKDHTLKAIGVTVIAVLALTSGASAALISYVDVTTGNTTFGDGSAFTTVTTDTADGIWRARTGFANGGTLFEARAGEDLTNMELRTTISGLTDGQEYNLYAYYWVAGYSVADPDPVGNQEWDIAAGLATGATTEYAWNGGTVTSTGDFDAAVVVLEDDRRMFQIDLGSIFADASGTEEIFINGTVGGDDRTWYDGVGYEVVPEPATLGLVAVFGGAVLFVRRKMII